jgi:lysyl-tRNA synthetase, class II
MGKVSFVHLSDGVERLQVYLRKGDVVGVRNDGAGPAPDGWEIVRLLDHGDFIGVTGYMFVTKTGELSIHVQTLQFLTKALLPMPDKMHGIADPEIRQRRRYVDLIAGALKVGKEPGELSTRAVFERRAALIRQMRRFLDDHGYIEVETPMLAPKATGAAAKPFKTHHNALDIPLYARIAPELYLKRLTVGGFEKVYELNRNFRNEGISYKHNPEFTMLEFYCAYMDVNGMMSFCEELLRACIAASNDGSLLVRFGDQEINFATFRRLTMRQAIAENWPEDRRTLDGDLVESSWFEDDQKLGQLYRFDQRMMLDPDKDKNEVWRQMIDGTETVALATSMDQATWVNELFEVYAEENLISPTFIVDYPKSISPLAKASPDNPAVAERFELFIAGMECANGFSELNDPQEQYERFLDQAVQRERGDDEAMGLDEDYVRALAYGMPPAAGIGIGIDRLAMLVTNRRSIRDVILFPHMRPERKNEDVTEDGPEQEN